jgi:glycosyltransferase involved in cell wall biosynthesis
MRKIIFYYPSKNIGGAQLLFVRLANELSKIPECSVAVIDYPNGFLRKSVCASVEVIDCYQGITTRTEESATIITPVSKIISIHRELLTAKGSKFLFWGIHPENTVDILRGATRLRGRGRISECILRIINFNTYYKVRRALVEGLENNSIFFMDSANRDRTITFYHLSNDCNEFIPVPVPELKQWELDIDMNKKVVAWIGRLSFDKIHSLLYTMSMLNKCGDFDFHIIGDGEARTFINNEDYDNLHITYHGSVSNDELHGVLVKKKIGLVFAMGTSVLESSMMSIPSILVDPSYCELPNNYSPNWLYNTKGYTLGTFKRLESNVTFDDLMVSYLVDSKNEIGRKCHRYVKDNHSMNSVIEKIITKIDSI